MPVFIYPFLYPITFKIQYCTVCVLHTMCYLNIQNFYED